MGLEEILKMANLSYTAAANSSASGLQTAIWTVKLVFLLTGAVSTAIAFKAAVMPCASYLVASALPGLWVFVTTLLFPPYIYIVFNFIVVVTVAASTTFNHRRHRQPQVVVPAPADRDSLQPPTGSLQLIGGTDVLQEVAGDQKPAGSSESPHEIRSCSPRRADYGEEAATGAGPESEAMTVLKGDTMEEVWRAITEKKKPARQLKKCDTWDTPPSAAAVGDEDEVQSAAAEAEPPRKSGVKEKSMLKSETLKFNCGGGGGVQASRRGRVIKREALPSRRDDELNRRVEAFIAKVTNQMRQQRQESDQHNNSYLQGRMVVNP